MITRDGYSKDNGIRPEGIAITFGKDLMESNGGAKEFLADFLHCMEHQDGIWMHKMRNAPTFEICDVYIIVMNRLYGKVKSAGIANGPAECYRSSGEMVIIDWQRMLLVGPFERCPFKLELKGFQGFRYTTKLF